MFWKYFLFSWTQLPRIAKAILTKFWATSKDVQIVIWLKSYNNSDPSNNKKLAKIIQTQPSAATALFSLSLSEFLQFYRQAAFYSFLEIFYISMLITCVTQTLRNFLHFNVKDMRPVSSNSSFPCKFRFWETKILNNLLMKVFKKKQMPFNICAKELLH